MSWGVYLSAAILVEVLATSSLKAAGEGRAWAIVVVALGYTSAFVLLALAVRDVEVGVAYAIWAGAGTALIAAIGIVVLDESLNVAKAAGIAFVVAGVVLLNLQGH